MPIILGLVVLIPAAIFATLNSESGSRWLLHRVLSALPAQASVSETEGDLLHEIAIKGLHYQSDTEIVDIEQLRLAWRPGDLVVGRLTVIEFSAENIDITRQPAETSTETEAFDWNAQVPMPLEVFIKHLAINRLRYQSGDNQFDLHYLKASAFTEQNRLVLSSLSLGTKTFEFDADGTMTLGRQFPFALQSHWQFDSNEYGRWQADTDIRGDINHVVVDSRQSSPFELTLNANVDQLQATPSFSIGGDWRKLTWPLASAQPQFVSDQGHIEIKGTTDDYQIQLAGPLTQDYLPQAKLSFAGQGSSEAITIEKLEIASSAGAFALNGKASWAQATTFDITATGQDFNPAIFAADFPGTLTFDTRVSGEINDGHTRINARIARLAGRLRGKPVQAQGSLAMLDDSFDIGDLILKSGSNRIDANGRLAAKDSKLSFNIDTPSLASLWPGLGGRLKGDGLIQGNWQNPDIRLRANGKSLRYEQYQIGKLDLNLAYHPDADTASELRLLAEQILTGRQSIQTLALEADGDAERHRLSLALKSPIADLKSRLEGGIRSETWRGQLKQLLVERSPAGNWRLTETADLRVMRTNAGIGVDLSRTCLNQKAASVCASADYSANSDFDAQLHANDLPLSLLQPFLPEQTGINGRLNAEIALNQRANLLSGDYRVTLPAPTKITFKDGETDHTLTLGQSTLQGNLTDGLIAANADLALTGSDYVRANARIDTGPSQTISGQISASIENLALIDALIPQLSDIQGQIIADVGIGGTINEPVANGKLQLQQASASIIKAGLTIKDMNLQLATVSGQNERFEVSGKAKSGDGSLELYGFADLNGILDIKLRGEDFSAVKLPEAEVNISPDLHMTYSEHGNQVNGQIIIPMAKITLHELPENAVAVSDDEVIVGEQTTEKKPLAEPGINANIDVELGDKVSFSGLGLNTQLVGRLNIVKTDQQTAMHGAIDMKKGHYKSYGQDLTLRKGRFLFNGPIGAPWLDVEASRLSKSGDITAVLSVSGPLKAPKTRVYSEPSLPESEALAYLITGAPLSQVGKSDANLVASAALSYGAGQLSWIKDKLGVDEFEIKQGKTLQDTLLAMGQNLTEDFYVGTKLGIFNQQAVLVLKHKLTKSLSVETQSGTSQRIKLNYEVDTD
ncbi:MAG: translocation/assembly module TamB domain-containing protein [Gammaproteobacteria bacterium]